MVIGKLSAIAAERLSSVCDNPLREARLLLAYTLSLSVTDIIIKPETNVTDDAEKSFWDNVEKRKNHMPMAYITGTQEFYGLKFKVCEGVLIPRPDTETLVDFILETQAKNILDICSGSGCIAIAAAKNLPDAMVCGVDISDTALDIAKENNLLNGTSVSFEKADILSEIPKGRFDLIVSNPPYITDAEMQTLMPDVKKYEPALALCGGSDGLDFYRRICEISPLILNKNGTLAFEIGYNQYDDVLRIMSHNFKDINFRCDLSGIKRVIYGKL